MRLTRDGLPVGLQIVGRMFDDWGVLQAAKAYEGIDPHFGRYPARLCMRMAGEILSNDEMRRADASAVKAGTPSLTLMENAGRAVADAIAARFAPCRVTVLCGPGNNGGDGFVVARLLAARGFDVVVAARDGSQGRCRRDGGAMAGRARSRCRRAALDGAALIVDALFGAGLSRPLEGRPIALWSRR